MLPPLDIGETLRLEPPLVNASGAVEVLGLDPDWQAPVALVRHLGAYVTKSVTPEPRTPRPEPRIEVVDDASLVNAVGLAGPGVDGTLAAWSKLSVLLGDTGCIVSLAARSADSFARLAARFDELDAIDGVELNLSCPNDDGHGLIAADPGEVEAVVRAVRAATRLPLLVKLSPACGRTTEVAKAAESAGCDALVATNTMPMRAIDAAGSELLGSRNGGLSGRRLHPIALAVVEEAAAATDLPVVGVGGIDGVAAARRMIDSGARALGVGTAAMLDDALVGELASWLAYLD